MVPDLKIVGPKKKKIVGPAILHLRDGAEEAVPYSHSTHRFQHSNLQETLNIVLVSGDYPPEAPVCA